MASTKRIEQKAATRAKVLAAAQELFTAHGYEAVSIRDVAAKAGVSSGAIFSSVDGKEALFEAAIGRKAPTAANLAAFMVDVMGAAPGLAIHDKARALRADLVGRS